MGSITITQAPDAKITRHPDGAIEVSDVPNESAVFDNRPTASEAYRRGPAPTSAPTSAAQFDQWTEARPWQPGDRWPSDMEQMVAAGKGSKIFAALPNTRVETAPAPQGTGEFPFPHTRIVDWADGAVIDLPWPLTQEKTVVRGGSGAMSFRITPPAGLDPSKSGFLTVAECPNTSLACDIGLFGQRGVVNERVASALQLSFRVASDQRDGISNLTPGEPVHLNVRQISATPFFIDFASPARY